MKPIKLTLNYIGPHKNTTIDFSLLEDFFLIGGNTGAGKTFIFDSIIHSIYGEPKKETYEERDKSLVSIDKPDNEIPSIEFIFSIGKAIYKVFRTLPYQKSTKKTKENATASLQQFNEQTNDYFQIENEPENVNEKLFSLIGLTKEEFKKIVILPQGEFQKFLKMTPKDKKDFLTKVFKNTQIFTNIKQKVAKDVREEQARIKMIEEELSNKSLEIDFENAEEILENTNQEIQKLTKERENSIKKQTEYSAQIENLKHKAQEAFDYQTNLESLIKLELQKEEIDNDKNKIELAKEAQKLDKVYTIKNQAQNEKLYTETQLENTKNKLNKKQENLKEIKATEENYNTNKKQISENEKQIEKIEKQLQKFSSIKTLQIKIQTLKTQSETIKNQIETKEKEIQELTSDFISKANVQVYKEEILLDLLNEQNKIEKQLETYKNQLEIAKEKESLAKEIQENTKKLEQVSLECQKYLEQKNVLTLFSKKNYAFYLAQNLTENECCPVCGSKTHPQLAEKPVETPEESQIIQAHKTLEDAIQNAETLLGQKQSEQNTLQTKINEAQKRIEKQKIDNTASELTQLIEDTSNIITQTKEKIEACKTIKSNLEKAKETLNELKQSESSTSTEYKSIQKELETIQKENFGKVDFDIDELETKLQQDYSSLQNQTETLSKECQQWEEINTSINQEIANLTGQLESIEKKLQKDTQNLQDAIQDFAQNLEQSAFKTEEQMLKALLPEQQFIQTEEKIKQWDSSYNELQVKIKTSKTTEDYSKISKELENLQQQFATLQEELNNANLVLKSKEESYTTLKNAINDITNKKLQIEQINKKLEPLVLLNSHLNGRPAIDTWATKLYFTNILDFANKRFAEITNGTYKFIFGKSSKEGVSDEDIDISVFEAATNMVRHSSSLSGGEEFLASISLALGLADAIQCQHTNAIIESMFIDEGFGSLDIEVQNRAIEVLKKLNDTRKIGIISHSENIEEDIDSRLIVTKENGVSTVAIYDKNTRIA